eukprot:3313919-Rhodomonas_salina.3
MSAVLRSWYSQLLRRFAVTRMHARLNSSAQGCASVNPPSPLRGSALECEQYHIRTKIACKVCRKNPGRL